MSTGSHEALHVLFKVVAFGGWGIALAYGVYSTVKEYLERRSRRAERRDQRAARRLRRKKR